MVQQERAMRVILQSIKAIVRVALMSTILSMYWNCDDSLAQIANQKFYGDDGLIYEFGIKRFTTETRFPGIHTKKQISKGSFSTDGDTLTINYIAFKNPPKAYFKIIDRKSILNLATFDSSLVDSSLYVHFKIVEENDRPIYPAPIVQIKNDSNKTIHGFQADSTGNIPEIFIFGKSDLIFKFTSLINEELVLDADTLMGYKSTVKVSLPKRIEYRQYEGREKYLFKQLSGNNFELRSLNGGRTVLLERIK
ncbi:hypothetical protein G3570_10085 [Balneolaceae bacterium YR4-1]|uniref:Uncharacterized protein n=1 Tax=Halalkalibaculum roseum TaxID=2709311 RepID=A0A6M1T9S8_9BACT|nr:hypothetical protein [Halalkalibaculum roseum]NGP76983.1 hypothetical protein [Halalkalibaculum roseum]